MKQADKLSCAKTQPFSHRVKVRPSRLASSLSPTGRLAVQAQSLERFQNALVFPDRELRPSQARVESNVASASRLKDAAFVIARWVTVGTAVVAIHWAAAKYMFLV
jgi:hypothetical protein